MGIACAEPPAYRDCMRPSQIPNSIFKQLTILVVAANAGIYTPRRSFWEKLFAGFRATTQACGYVSRRSPGRRRGRIFKMHVRILATRCARGLRELSRLEIRGRRECRVHAAPAVSRAKLCKKTHTSIQVQRRQSDIPCAMVLRLISRSPRRSGFLVTVACDAATANLTPASRRQDHTTSPSA